METALERIVRLERHNRRMAIALIGLLFVFAVSVTAARSAGDTVIASVLAITDDSGKGRIVMTGVPSGSLITMTDTAQRSRLSLAASTGKAIVQFNDSSKSEAASFEQTREYSGIFGESKGGSAFFGTTQSVPGIEVRNNNGTAKISLTSTGPSLILFDGADKQRVALGQSDAGNYGGSIAGRSGDTDDYSMP
jgi:hypothetical protein